MNPEPDSADNEAPQEAPAATSAAAPMPAAAEPAATLPAAAEEAPDAVPAASAPAPDLSPAATGARLAELFPALFVGPDGKGTWKPIKLRIHADIQARAPGQFSKRTLGLFFARYTTTTPYLKALAAPGAQRCDLDGQPAGEIAEEHRSAAAEEVARRQAIAAERRAAFRPPRRAAQPAAEGHASAGADREARPDHRPGSAPEVRPAQRPGRKLVDGPATRAPLPPEARQRSERRHQPGADARPSSPPTQPTRPPRGVDRAPHSARPQSSERAPNLPHVVAPAPLPADPAQRERAMLLRAFESSPLSKANFCVLKRISEADLDAALVQAKAERGELGPPAAQRRGGEQA